MPATDYSTEKGVGLGVVGMIAQFREGYYPYQWRLFFIARATMAIDKEGQFGLPFHEYKFKFDLPGLDGGKLRLRGEAGFFRFITTGYYGFGNAAPRDPSRPSQFYRYDRIYPRALLDVQYFLWQRGRRRLSVFAGVAFHYNVTNLFKHSLLAQDLQRSQRGADQVSSYLREHLRGLSPHPLLAGKLGLLWDSRDHEFNPSRGMFHEISVRGSPGVGTQLYFLGFHAGLRFYIPVWRQYLVVAARLLADILVGQVPFYELALYGGFSIEDGPAGGKGIRGMANQRLYGKIKLIGNLELRSMFLPFRLFGQRFNFGLTAFVDAGRVWLDFSFPTPEVQAWLDGTGLELHVGVGGGLRLQWGETFLIRFDLAWTPTDQQFGFYFTLGHLF